MRTRAVPRGRFWQAGSLGFRGGSGGGAQSASPPLSVRSVIGLGDELLLNGGFATDTVWTHSPQWVLGGNSATGTAVTVTDDLVQTVTLVTFASYQVTYTQNTNPTGAISWKLSNGQVGAIRSVAGTFTEQFQVSSAATDFRFVRRGSDFTGAISAASLKRIL